MAYFSKRALRWAAPVALVGALGLAACGDNDSDQAIKTNARPVEQASGLDNHLDVRAVELAQQARAYRAAAVSAGFDNHLDIRAAEIASQRADRAASARLTGQAEQMQRAQAARLAAQAEQSEWSAHLEGQADTHSGSGVPNAFEAGNRAAQKAQADGYVEQLQDRAESSSYDGEFVPGSRHMPTR
jgi:hypothetical protein